MIGEASGIVPDRGLNILYRTTLNTFMNLTDAGLTTDNVNISTQSQANTRLGADTPKGILQVGSVDGTVVRAVGTSATAALVGVAINNAVGYPFESSSGVASGKAPYIHGSGTVFATDLYETVSAALAPLAYAAGNVLFASQNGLLTKETMTNTTVVGIVLRAPSTSDPFMVVQMRI
jgi:hypothetical protein